MLSIEQLQVCRGAEQQGFTVTLPHLELQAGQVKAITGLSGCGKSTLLEAIGLILQPQYLQSYRLGPEPLDLTNMLTSANQTTLADIRSQRLGFILQSGGLLPYLPARLNINLPRRLLGLSPWCDQVQQAVERLRLGHLLEQLPAQLSIGEQQRVAFVRAIAHQPQLLLADEPTSALDPHTAQELFALILDIVRDQKIAALVVIHDWQLVQKFDIPCLQAIADGDRGSIFHAS